MKKRLSLMLLLMSIMLAMFLPVDAQNVTISPSTGNLVAALTSDNEVGFQNGWSSMWRHEQLPLTLTTADDAILTQSGEQENPAGNICVYNGNLVIGGGVQADCYFVASLPKGYRITGYRIVFLNNLNNATVNGLRYNGQTKNIYETDATFNTSSPKASLATVANPTTPATMPATNNTTEYEIARTGNDMTNHIYFRITHGNPVQDRYYGVTIKSFELFFTAQGDFTEDLSPALLFSEGVNMVKCPFKTSRLDIGALTPNTKNNQTYYSYDYRNVKDLVAYNAFYQTEAVANGDLPEEAGAGNIFTAQFEGDNYYALNKNTTYYVETPITGVTQTDVSLNLGYRIVKAKINYQYGAGDIVNEITTDYQRFSISYTSGSTTYFIGEDGLATTTTYNKWFIDEEGYIRCGDEGQYYLCNTRTETINGGQSGRRTETSTDKSKAVQCTITNGYISYQSGNTTYWLQWGAYTTGYGYYQTTHPDFRFNNNQQNRVTANYLDQYTTLVTATEDAGTTTASSYTLKVYDKTGNTLLVDPIEVSSTNPSGTIDLDDLNNDAIKFEIDDLEEGGSALITFDLTLQALNPYIKSLGIVCQETTGQGRKLTQQFTSNNFAVRGGKFYFYVPEDYEMPCKFTFEELKSDYGDNTYYGNTTSKDYSRYSFVNSPYWTENSDLYASTYDPDFNYEDKVYTLVAGTKKFHFNNADELSNTSGATDENSYEEYPFSLNAYAADGGEFGEILLDEDETGTAYLFTCDETRYNIAPTTAIQHRYYAFYQMELELDRLNYTPEFEWTKIYDETFYQDDEGNVREDSMWGVKVKTTASSPEGEFGYLTVSQIASGIESELGQTGRPESKDQILYVDCSKLLSVVQNEVKNVSDNSVTIHEMDELKEGIATNALVYLPLNTTTGFTNFVVLQKDESFRAADDVVITDKQPFYAPMGFQVDAAKYARYERLITIAKNGKVTKATIILPFAISVDGEGKHTNEDTNEQTVAVHTMQATNCLDEDQEKQYTAYFPVMSDVTATTANTPYLVEVLSQADGDKINFVITQKGAQFVATSSMESDYTFEGETSTGTANGISYNFLHRGDYTGKKLAIGSHCYYFSKNKFVCADELKEEFEYAKLFPFRTFYVASSSAGANFLPGFDVTLGEGYGSDGINTLDKAQIDLMVLTGNGTLTLTSSIDQQVDVTRIDGSKMSSLSLRGGDSKTINLPSGIYIINGVKVIVK